MREGYLPLHVQRENTEKSEVLQCTLDLMVLKVLDALGAQYGRRIGQWSEQVVQLNAIE